MLGVSQVYWGVRGVLGAGRECRYSGPEGYRWHRRALGVASGLGA